MSLPEEKPDQLPEPDSNFSFWLLLIIVIILGIIIMCLKILNPDRIF